VSQSLNKKKVTIKDRFCVCLLGLTVCIGAGGCAVVPDTGVSAFGDRDKGLVIILPGIQGNGSINEEIRQALIGSGVQCAVEIRQWGFLIPGAKLLVNQVNVPGNRQAGQKIAEQLAAYQARHPSRPVYVIGHSGGAGIGVFAMEHLARMPDSRPITGAVLLSASISSDYDLTAALSQSREGIVNFYNDRDVGNPPFLEAFLWRVAGLSDEGRKQDLSRFPVGLQVSSER